MLSGKWQNPHPDRCLVCSTTSQNTLEGINKLRHQLSGSTTGPNMGYDKFITKKRKKGEKEGSTQTTGFARLLQSSSLSSAGRRQTLQTRVLFPDPSHASHELFSRSSPALFSSTAALNSSKDQLVQLCSINAHLNLKTFFQQRSPLVPRPEVSLECPGY